MSIVSSVCAIATRMCASRNEAIVFFVHCFTFSIPYPSTLFGTSSSGHLTFMAAQAEEKKEEHEHKYDARIQTFLDTFYCPKDSKFENAQEFVEGVTAKFHKDCELISSSYHKEKSEMIRVSGRKAVIAYFTQLFEQSDAVRWKCDIHSVSVHNLKVTVKVKFYCLNAQKEEVIAYDTEDTNVLNEEGLLIHIVSMTQDFDIVKLHTKQMVHKAGPSIHLDDNKAVITCLDADFNEVSYDLNLKENINKLNQIHKIVKEAESQKKDAMIVIVEPEQKNGRRIPIVSHAVLAE